MSKLHEAQTLNILTPHIKWDDAKRREDGKFVGPVSFNISYPWIMEEIKRWNEKNNRRPKYIVVNDPNWSDMSYAFVYENATGEYVHATEDCYYTLKTDAFEKKVINNA